MPNGRENIERFDDIKYSGGIEMEITFKGKSALVTGAAAGMGLAAAKAFAEAGAAVALADIDASAVEREAAELA